MTDTTQNGLTPKPGTDNPLTTDQKELRKAMSEDVASNVSLLVGLPSPL